MLFDLVVAEPANQRQASAFILRVQNIDQAQQTIGIERRAALEADRVLDATAEFNVRVIGLARTIANPNHVAAGRVPIAAR